MMLELALVCVAAYLIGSIPFGLLLTKAAGLGDIRQIGSGNIGATNVLRTGNKKLAALTLFLDGFKGWVVVFNVVYVVRFLLSPIAVDDPAQAMGQGMLEVFLMYLCFLFVIFGHCFPIWLKFKGGKGVATTFGAILGLQPWLALVALVTWLIVAVIARRSSLAALAACVAVPIASIIHGFMARLCFSNPSGQTLCTSIDFFTPAVLLIASLLVISRHKENIKRLIAGTEPKIGKKV